MFVPPSKHASPEGFTLYVCVCLSYQGEVQGLGESGCCQVLSQQLRQFIQRELSVRHKCIKTRTFLGSTHMNI